MKRVFRVHAVWDAEAEVFYSVSDIEGFHIEASNRDEFEAIMKDVAPELIVSNHRTTSEIQCVLSKRADTRDSVATPGNQEGGGVILPPISTPNL